MRKYSVEEFLKAVSESISIAGTLTKLNLRPHGANYRTFKKLLKETNVDISHFLGQAHGTSKLSDEVLIRRKQKRYKDSEVFCPNSTYSTSTLKYRILKDNLLDYKCHICGIKNWLNKNISLHLDHINGINNDHRLENLRFLCPNCHSQTETYCGKNNMGS